MNRKISFHNMEHSDPLEQHAHAKLDKVEELLKRDKEASPLNVELRLTSHKPHSHHHVEMHVKTPRFDLNAHHEGPDMYITLDQTIDTMLGLIKKQKSKHRTQQKKKDSPKNSFGSGKYSL